MSESQARSVGLATFANTPLTRFLIVAAACVVVLAGMRAAESILVPFLLSLFIAVLCSPPLLWLSRHKVPNGLAILIVLSVIIALFALVSMVVGSSVADFREDLPSYQARLRGQADQWLAWLAAKGIDLDPNIWRDNINPGAVLGFAGNALASFGNMMTNFFLILLTVAFILAEEVGFADKLRSARPNADASVTAIGRFTHAVNRYMAMKTWISMLTGSLALLWCYSIGLDYAPLWGLLAFLFNFIPNLGSIIAAIPPVLLALVQLGVGDAVLTAVVYVAINTLIGNILEPRFMGKGLNLSALVVFLSLVFWGWVLGPVGMLLSVPLTMTVKIALESFEETRWIGAMMGSGVASVEALLEHQSAAGRGPEMASEVSPEAAPGEVPKKENEVKNAE